MDIRIHGNEMLETALTSAVGRRFNSARHTNSKTSVIDELQGFLFYRRHPESGYGILPPIHCDAINMILLMQNKGIFRMP